MIKNTITIASIVSNNIHVHIAAIQFFKISSAILILFSSLSTIIIQINYVKNNAAAGADNDYDNDEYKGKTVV